MAMPASPQAVEIAAIISSDMDVSSLLWVEISPMPVSYNKKSCF
jgi:hypothetical protein